MNPAIIIRGIVLKLTFKHPKLRSLLRLSFPPALSEFQWDKNNFEKLIERFIGHVLEISHPAKSVKIAVHEMKRKTDLENFFSISPKYWFNLSVEIQAESGFECGAKKILEDLGYCCSEWVGVEESEAQLGAFRFGTEDRPALILIVQNHGARRNCDFLIPVADSLSQFA